MVQSMSSRHSMYAIFTYIGWFEGSTDHMTDMECLGKVKHHSHLHRNSRYLPSLSLPAAPPTARRTWHAPPTRTGEAPSDRPIPGGGEDFVRPLHVRRRREGEVVKAWWSTTRGGEGESVLLDRVEVRFSVGVFVT